MTGPEATGVYLLLTVYLPAAAAMAVVLMLTRGRVRAVIALAVAGLMGLWALFILAVGLFYPAPLGTLLLGFVLLAAISVGMGLLGLRFWRSAGSPNKRKL